MCWTFDEDRHSPFETSNKISTPQCVSSTNLSTIPVLSMITEAHGTMAVDITIVCKIMNDNHSRVDNIFIVLRRISSEKSDRDWFLSTTLKSMLTVLSSAIGLCYSSSDSVGKSLCFSQQSHFLPVI